MNIWKCGLLFRISHFIFGTAIEESSRNLNYSISIWNYFQQFSTLFSTFSII